MFKSKTYEDLRRLAAAYPALSHEEQQHLACRASAGDEKAKELLLKHNLERVLFFCDMYTPDGPGLKQKKLEPRMYLMSKWREHAPKTITVDDIASAALEGLNKAINYYDPSRGKFNSFANVVIWQQIQHLREKEERRLSHITQSPISDSEIENELAIDIEREAYEMARMLFSWYARKYLPPMEYVLLEKMLAGAIPFDESFLVKVRETLKQKIPEADWYFLGEILTGSLEVKVRD